VEVASDGQNILVRDSKAVGKGPILSFTLAEWSAFLSGVRAGEFEIGDNLIG
jgi:hypothetical protein